MSDYNTPQKHKKQPQNLDIEFQIPDGLDPENSEDCKEIARLRKNAYNRAYRAANKERLNENKKKWYYANRQRSIETTKAWQRDNPERRAQNRRSWFSKHPEVRRASSHRYNARKRGAKGSFTAQEIRDLYDQQKGKCWWCGKKLNNVYQIDHRIPLSKGGSNDVSNLVIACPFCNLSKNDKMPHEWNGRLL